MKWQDSQHVKCVENKREITIIQQYFILFIVCCATRASHQQSHLLEA